MKIYLDNCCYNRPYDDQSSLKIALETQAKLYIQNLILNKKHELIWSSILDYENLQNPYEIRRNSISQWRELAIKNQIATSEVVKVAKLIMQKGIKNKDALHLASAIVSKADIFITVDKKILQTKIENIQIANPIDFLNYEEA